MSRRAAEEKIKKRLVKVNGVVAELGLRIDPGRDTVEYNGKRVLPDGEDKCYVMLNKPRGFVTTLSDEKARHTVAELVSGVKTRVWPVGRLDMDSDGLLLMTNDGELTNRLTHPRHEIPKIYHVTVSGKVASDTLEALSRPMIIDGYEILPVKVRELGFDGSSTLLEFTLCEGRNRQIRKMCDTQGLKISRLCRVAVGELSLGSLALGKWRYLSSEEVDYLRGHTK